MATKVKLSKRVVESLVCEPGKSRTYVYDSVVPALAVFVSSAGTKAFYVYRRVQGRPVQFRLGGFPEMSVEQARKAASTTNLQILAGENPQVARAQHREEPTLGDLFDLWMTHAKAHKRTWDQDDYQYERFFKKWSNRKVQAIRRTDVAKLHAEIGESSGIHTANRALALLRAIYNHGRKMLELDVQNPAAAVKAYREEPRDRRLQSDELPAFFKALEEEPNQDIRDYVYLSLFTGARKSNVMGMRWADISFDRKLWVVAGAQSKNGHALLIVLSEESMRILLERRQRADSAQTFVFPGSGKTGHLKDPKYSWARICRRAGVEGLRLHDLRRTLGSYEADVGASLEVIGKTLGHMSAQTTRVYARLALDPVREAVERACALMVQAANQGSMQRGGGRTWR
jgi:integrase